MANSDAKKALRPVKPIFKLDVPHAQVQWPQLAAADHDMMLGKLVDLLAPIGQHRSSYVRPSKGKRSRPRKRKAESSGEGAMPLVPPPPDITHYITVGINSTTRHLEQLARSSVDLRNIPLVFILHSTSSIMTAHLPLLVQAASLRSGSLETTRLIPLKPVSEPMLAGALGLPRVGVVSIMDGAPGAQSLVDYVFEKVAPTQVPWLREASDGCYLPVNVLTQQPKPRVGTGGDEAASETTDTHSLRKAHEIDC